MTGSAIARFVDAVPFAALVISSDERLLAINEAARQLLGGSSIGRHYVTALRQPEAIAAVDGCLRDRARRRAGFVAREGRRETLWQLDVAALEADPPGAVFVTFSDLTALEDAKRMRRDFIANVSHEMRTPITALSGFIETLQGPARDDAAARARFLDIMAHEAARMRQLVDDLLSLSRVEENLRVRPTEPVAIGRLIVGSVAALEPLARARDVTLRAEIAEGVPDLPGDEAQLRQVLVNLVANAIKYGRAGGTVTIRLDPPALVPSMAQPAARISVRDEGEGIAPQHIPRLTERFYRVDDHRSREMGGTGLGLAIVSHIVDRHRGQMRIESRVGQGSEFSILLPVGL